MFASLKGICQAEMWNLEEETERYENIFVLLMQSLISEKKKENLLKKEASLFKLSLKVVFKWKTENQVNRKPYWNIVIVRNQTVKVEQSNAEDQCFM